MTTNLPGVQDLIDTLNLQAHIEGGFFRRTFQADKRPLIDTAAGERYTMTSIFYLLTAESPIGYWHLNRSDIVHYFHLGDPIEYNLIWPDGSLEQTVVGSDVLAGQQLQLTVPGGVWKSSRLGGDLHGYGLISEAVSPGFEFSDMTIGQTQSLSDQFPQHRRLIERFSKA